MSDVLAAKGDNESRILYQAKAIEALPSVQQQTPIQEVQSEAPADGVETINNEESIMSSPRITFSTRKILATIPGRERWAALQILDATADVYEPCGFRR